MPSHMTELTAQPKKRSLLKKLILNLIKIIIAVGGLWWVIAHTPWNDVVTIKAGTHIAALEIVEPLEVTLLRKPASKPVAVYVGLPTKPVKVKDADGRAFTGVLRPDAVTRETEIPNDWLVTVEGDTTVPKVQVGLRNLIRTANPWLFVASWSLLCIPFFVSAWRWRKLMQPQGINLPFSKCLALTFVGQFYSTFLPGITGGDLVKIIYTSRVVGSKTKATVTILLDRVIGLIALVVIAGIAAACQVRNNPMMWWVLLGIVAALGTLVLMSTVYFSHRLRSITGLEKLLNHSSTPAFIRRPKISASSASCRGVSATRSSVTRSPRATFASHWSRSAIFAPRRSPCCDADDGPSPIHSCMCQVLRLCRQACPACAKLETSYCA